MKKGLNLRREIENKFSFSYGVRERLYSEFEVLLQKLWYMRINKLPKANLSRLDDLEDGYSCVFELADTEKRHDVFKYVTKANSSDGEIMTFEQFETLFNALENKKAIQGYGVFRNIDFDEVDNSYLIAWDEYIRYLRSVEAPVVTTQKFDEVLFNVCQEQREATYISRRTIFKLMRDGNIEASPEAIKAYVERKAQDREEKRLDDQKKAQNEAQGWHNAVIVPARRRKFRKVSRKENAALNRAFGGKVYKNGRWVYEKDEVRNE
jgi:hypothetical protein